MAAPRDIPGKHGLYREVNMRIREVAGTFSGDGPVEFVCECGRRDCRATIALTESQWDSLASEGDFMLLTTAHRAAADGGRIIAENARYVLAVPA
jgi:hypothetical protein